MIVEMKMFGCECDNCGAAWRDDHSGYICFTDEASMRQHVSEDEWWYTEHAYYDKHYCPKCWSIDENDVVTIKNNLPKA